MTALTLALVAGMAVGSDGTEKFSTETEEQLGINGYWEGNLRFEINNEVSTNCVKLENGVLIIGRIRNQCRWVDEGRGRCLQILDENSI